MNANFINELLDVLDTTGANLSTRGGILDLIEKYIPKDEPQEQENSNLLTAAEWKALGYKQRLELFNTNKEAYDAALQGNFKEDK